MLRGLIDRVLIGMAHVVLRAFFRSVEVDGVAQVPTDRPLLIVANHLNGFVDAVMLVRVFGRLPRFLAKSTLWSSPLARPLLAVAGTIPVSRWSDHADMAANVRTFAAAERVLISGGLVGVFPEGLTHDDPAVRRLRTGAARIALGAHARGAQRALIVAVGLTFDDKIATRARVLARVAQPIDLDAVVASLHGGAGDGEAGHGGAGKGAVDADDRAAVVALTDLIGQRLREVAPHFRSDREASVLGRAAEISLRPSHADRAGRVPLSDREAVARRLAASAPPLRRAVSDAVARYHLDLEIAGLQDAQVVSRLGPRQLLLQTLGTSLRVVVLAPLAFFGGLWNVVPYGLVISAGHLVRRPVNKGTVRMLVALAAFPVAWSAVALLDPWRGVLPTLAVFVLAPVLGLVAVTTFEQASGVVAAWRAWVGRTERRARLESVLASRREVIEAVDRALLAAGTSHSAQAP